MSGPPTHTTDQVVTVWWRGAPRQDGSRIEVRRYPDGEAAAMAKGPQDTGLWLPLHHRVTCTQYGLAVGVEFEQVATQLLFGSTQLRTGRR